MQTISSAKIMRLRNNFHRAQRTGRPADNTLSAMAFSTDLGWMAAAGRDRSIVGVVFGITSRRGAERMLASRSPCPPDFADQPDWLADVAERLTRYAAGDAIDFRDIVVKLDHLTPFARRVVAACRRILRGSTRSYGDLARACGAPGAARAVGSVMAKNRYPLLVPCHRVIGAAGALGGYSAPEGLAMKRRLLAMEGASIRNGLIAAVVR
jgi:methylated-DNA-[protein]-cysteine S-methyltransferase